ncbi:transcriptional adapter 2-alpha-like [Ptychodera flava]|uniref:transcriptional adapter 2-alpha-like n=1 Tax=Ptychodera flava TaxID=63121 RepID=UPI00396A808E
MATPDDRPPCPGCSSYLMEPFIRCDVCGPPLYLCLQCFSHGWEGEGHENNHAYEIITNDFTILEAGWTAKEEIALLDAIGDCGLGNWGDVANQVQTKTKEECGQHYLNCFIKNPKPPLPALPDYTRAKPIKPILCKLSEDPPRPAKDSQKANEMAGYIAARGDFNEEYDNYAEWDIKDLYFADDDDRLLAALKLGAVQIFYARLRERHRRKRILKDYGLLNLWKQHMLERKHSRYIRELFEKTRPYMRLQSPEKHDKMLEGFIYEYDLQNEVKRLVEYVENGITTFRGARLFDKLKARREEQKSKRNMLSDVLGNVEDQNACQQWLQRQAQLDNGQMQLPSVFPSMGRKSAPPLDLKNFPGYDKLTEAEKEMCASVRIIPEAYFEYKRILVSEFSKQGFLRLKQARNLIKIDVNKTRKLYDFMVQQGMINTV